MNNIKLLFVDDDIVFSSLLMDIMKRAGWDIRYQNSLSGCPLAIQDWEPDLVLLDMKLNADENGIDAISTIKLFAPEKPIVIISSHIDAQYEARTYRLGGTDFIKKPIVDEDAFIERIESHIPRFQKSTVSIGSLTLDWKQRRLCSSSGEIIKLSRNELQLIKLLIANQNHMVVYSQIAKCLWPDKNQPDSSEYVIHNRMNHLKRYFSKGGVSLECFRGKGYKLEL